MKILSTDQIRQADAYTISHEPIKSIDLMERAAGKCFDWMEDRINVEDQILIVCGPGNNGGDGLALARMLHEKSFQVEVIILRFTEDFSYDFQLNMQRLNDLHINIQQLTDADKFKIDSGITIIVDAIFGSGLSRPVEGFVGDILEQINLSEKVIVSIDIPSGLFADQHTPTKGKVIHADYTLSFELPKLAFFLPECDSFIGELEILPIGLHPDFLNVQESPYEWMLPLELSLILKDRQRFSHKGSFGHAVLIAGSQGKMGAAVLGSKACLRSGVGLLTTCVPNSFEDILHHTIPECMVIRHDKDVAFHQSVEQIDFNAIGVGPGIGETEEMENALKVLIQNTKIPMLLDADALNILAKNKTWMSFLPTGSILTPHPGEFRRLAGNWDHDFHKLELQKEMAQKYQVYVVLKGANTSIACPDGKIYFNSSGNPGMATAGSGDVLSGIILALMAQGYTSKEASLLGTYVHGLSGDLSLTDQSLESLIASDIIDNLGKAFQEVERLNY